MSWRKLLDLKLSARLTEKVVWQLLRPYATAARVPRIAPHDLRRSCAKMCRAAGGELEQIQLLLGHASVQTTGRYRGTKQDLVNPPNDGIKLKLPVQSDRLLVPLRCGEGFDLLGHHAIHFDCAKPVNVAANRQKIHHFEPVRLKLTQRIQVRRHSVINRAEGNFCLGAPEFYRARR